MLPSSPGWSARLAMIVNLPTGVDGGSIVASVACFGYKKCGPLAGENRYSHHPIVGAG